MTLRDKITPVFEPSPFLKENGGSAISLLCYPVWAKDSDRTVTSSGVPSKEPRAFPLEGKGKSCTRIAFYILILPLLYLSGLNSFPNCGLYTLLYTEWYCLLLLALHSELYSWDGNILKHCLEEISNKAIVSKKPFTPSYIWTYIRNHAP